MKIQEAINVMEKYTDKTISKTVIEAHNMAIEALKSKKEMQLLPPKTSTFTYKGTCPVCGNHILLSEKYCSQCGQKLGGVRNEEAKEKR